MTLLGAIGENFPVFTSGVVHTRKAATTSMSRLFCHLDFNAAETDPILEEEFYDILGAWVQERVVSYPMGSLTLGEKASGDSLLLLALKLTLIKAQRWLLLRRGESFSEASI